MQEENMEYRTWAYEDVLAIAAMEKECFPDPWSYKMLADTFFNGTSLTCLAEEDGQIHGYGFLIVAGDEADLANIAVQEKSRRRGIAQGILETLEREAKLLGVRRLFLEVRVSNAPAMALYLRRGFVGRYVRPRYYGDGEDALVMVKELQD